MSRLALVILVSLSVCAAVAAQPEDDPRAKDASGQTDPQSPSAEARPSDGGVVERRPETYYLKDKDGNLVPVLDLPFEKFEKLYRLDQQLAHPDQPPRYAIEQLTITGTVENARAQLDVQLKLKCLADGWTRAPLALQQAVVRGAAEHVGPGEHFLHVDKEGFAWWINSQADTEHTLTLKLLLALERLGDRSRMHLSVPRAVNSQLELNVPLSEVAANISDGATLLAPQAVDEQHTQLKALGLSPQFQLVWGPRISEPGARPHLEAQGQIRAWIENPQSVRSEATLSVRNTNGALGEFLVRLPSGAELADTPHARYTATLLAGNGDAADAAGNGGSLVRIEPLGEPTDALQVRLNTETAIVQDDPAAECQLGGFEVVGASRQTGRVALYAAGDWPLHWIEGPRVGRLDQLPETMRDERLVAGFEYYDQPFSLLVRVLPRGTRLSVEPRYLLQVEDDHVLLEALLRYTVRGAKVSFVEVDLPGWDVESVEPEGRVLSEALSWTQVEPFVVRLAQPASGQFDLTLRARRRIDPSATALSLPLPQVRAARVSPAAIAVLSADNVELTPADDQAPELTPDTSPPAWELPARQQDPLYFQASGQESPLSFRCGFAVHQQAVSVDVHTEIRFEDRRAAVEQAFSYRVAHQPLHQLLLQADPSITRSGNLELTLDGQPLTAQPLRDESGAATEPQSVPLRVNLPAARIGACRLVVRYQTPLETVGDDGPNQAIVPLVMPEQGQLQQNTLAVLNGRSMDIELPDPSLWQPDAQAADEASSAGAVGFSSQQGTTRFELIASFPSASAEEPLRIDKTWIQCWLTHSARVDRATFRFSTGHDHVRISLPENVARDRCEFVLDGKRAAPVETNGQPLRVDLPLADRDRDHVLEVICRFEERPRPGRLQVQLPRLEGAQWTSHTYWELVLPIDEHLLFGPEEMNCEQRWQRSAWRVQRRPTLSQRQLEHWMGASRQAPPSSGVNRYLFSALTSPPQLASYSIRRQFALLVFSGTALIVGLLVIYVPVVRHPVGLLVFGVLVLVVGLQQPVPAILIAQAALFGLALAIGAYLLRSALMRRRFRRAVIHGMAAPVAEDRGDIDSHASTRTGPTPLPPPEPDPSE